MKNMTETTCPHCRGYELERQWCDVCGGSGTIANARANWNKLADPLRKALEKIASSSKVEEGDVAPVDRLRALQVNEPSSSPNGVGQMKIKISKGTGGGYVVDPVDLPGMPPVDQGASVTEAMGNFVAHYHKQIGLEIEVDASAVDAALQEHLEVATARAAFYFGKQG